LTRWFQFLGEITLFGVRGIDRSFRLPFELQAIWNQIEEVGSRSLSLLAASEFVLGVVMTLHTHSTLVMFGNSVRNG
jgi:phospholipid/cholesterol/gamma-HCH transport system permease protein